MNLTFPSYYELIRKGNVCNDNKSRVDTHTREINEMVNGCVHCCLKISQESSEDDPSIYEGMPPHQITPTSPISLAFYSKRFEINCHVIRHLIKSGESSFSVYLEKVSILCCVYRGSDFSTIKMQQKNLFVSATDLIVLIMHGMEIMLAVFK